MYHAAIWATNYKRWLWTSSSLLYEHIRILQIWNNIKLGTIDSLNLKIRIKLTEWLEIGQTLGPKAWSAAGYPCCRRWRGLYGDASEHTSHQHHDLHNNLTHKKNNLEYLKKPRTLISHLGKDFITAITETANHWTRWGM